MMLQNQHKMPLLKQSIKIKQFLNMVAKIDFATLKMYQQMRLKIAKNQKQPPSTQNLFVLIKKESVLP